MTKEEKQKYNKDRYERLKLIDPDFLIKEREKSKIYYTKNKKEINKKRSIYNKNNREKNNLRVKSYRERNKESYQLKVKKYRSENKDVIKNKILKKKFNISLEEYNTMLQNQNHKCNICKTEKTELGRLLCVDHCHETGIIRGLLCDRCNRGIGVFKDNVILLTEAIKYIKNNGKNS